MFYDKAKIYVKAGDGGNGIVAFRREKYVPEGGPNGGDGGDGGSVILIGDKGLRTLVDFKYKPHVKAKKGEHGQGKNRHGRNAEDTILSVPLGTIVKNFDTGELIADVTEDGQRVVVARGGRGGRGNARFASAKNRVPVVAEKGEPGEEVTLFLELKLLADVGLIGMPNAGKSTLISVISAAKPKIADYPFTTLKPNLGVVSVDEGSSFVVADIPGLIEGAHQGAGLGHEFLRHIERTRIFVHVLDLTPVEDKNIIEAFNTINKELVLYNPKLADKKQIIAANKMDVSGAEKNLELLSKELEGKYEIFPISAVAGTGLKPLIGRIAQLIDEIEPEPLYAGDEIKIFCEPEERFTIDREDGIFVVKGKEVEKHFAMTDFNNEEGVRRFQRILKVMGVENALLEKGINYGDTVRIGDLEFEFVE
ncbi:GTPase ObgE [Desulfitibacter alkalitolerans]|uniref:GTPase ObgE n=1 Tax=Desulfitibacter alkalitolerans TaxID=264641 RepID=UPI0004808EED|nr:GTPase ObgE [Desulfitibacter alkalitolerans]